ncbi:hypothetical protein CAEBREN_14669 [Caenorhabditis brenneri]|uniref:Uncharacterized protein n=1 Tax=Caenorhabditis brenneri TaxID=135651 RepID=G0NS62_CAEBE|nr:hypothetical protein CAEBREN_14669 [Caenorhabditis brenneri]
MSSPKESTRVSLRIKRAEADKNLEMRSVALAREAKRVAEKRNSNSSQRTPSDKENKPAVQAHKTTRPKKLALRKSNVKVSTPPVQITFSSNLSTSSKKKTPPKKSAANKTTDKSNFKISTPQAQSSSSNSSAPERPLGLSEPRRTVTTSTPPQAQGCSSSNQTASKRPIAPADDSEAGPSEPKRAAPTPSPQSENVVEKKPYIKYDYLPEEYLQPNWWTLPAVKTTDGSPILFKQKIASIVVGEGWEEDKVEYSDPPSRPKAVIEEPRPIQSSNEHTQLMHALQHFVHTLNKLGTDVFEKLVDEIDNLVDVIQSENKTKYLNLYAIQMDTYMYQIFSCLKPDAECQGEGIYVRQFFELLKKSISLWYTKDEKTKEEMMLIIQQNIIPLKMYGEQKVIPCDKVIFHIKRFAEHILNESRAQF